MKFICFRFFLLNFVFVFSTFLVFFCFCFLCVIQRTVEQIASKRNGKKHGLIVEFLEIVVGFLSFGSAFSVNIHHIRTIKPTENWMKNKNVTLTPQHLHFPCDSPMWHRHSTHQIAIFSSPKHHIKHFQCEYRFACQHWIQLPHEQTYSETQLLDWNFICIWIQYIHIHYRHTYSHTQSLIHMNKIIIKENKRMKTIEKKN